MTTKKTVYVTLTIDVEVDETKFTDEFMQEFRETFYQFNGLDDHIEHRAQLHARGIYDDDSFIEGYGQASDMGIRLAHIDTETVVA